ncbi:DMT family transporter [bacterium]|nr:DMT family transporter [bacterium]
MKNKIESRYTLRADLWLLIICAAWGMSFPLVKIALNDISPILFLAIRFWMGALFLLPVLWFCHTRINTDRLLRGSILGLFMFLGMLFQTLGLKFTTASNSGFITGITVVIVPILVIIIENRIPKWPVLTGALIAMIGLYFLTQPQTRGFNKGDLLTLICALSFSFEIVYIELLVRKGEAFVMAFIMICITALLATVTGILSERQFICPTRSMLTSLGFVALFCTALGFSLQTYWQPKTSATAASVIYTSEPVFASLFAALLLKERLDASGYIGGGLIVTGMFIAELRRRF